MPTCYAPNCAHRKIRDGCQFFRFPKDKKQLALWIKMCRRSDKVPNDNDRLCSCHFPHGKKDVPKIFSWTRGKEIEFSSPEKKNKKRKQSPEKIQCNRIHCRLDFTDPSSSVKLQPQLPYISSPLAQKINWKIKSCVNNFNISPQENVIHVTDVDTIPFISSNQPVSHSDVSSPNLEQHIPDDDPDSCHTVTTSNNFIDSCNTPLFPKSSFKTIPSVVYSSCSATSFSVSSIYCHTKPISSSQQFTSTSHLCDTSVNHTCRPLPITNLSVTPTSLSSFDSPNYNPQLFSSSDSNVSNSHSPYQESLPSSSAHYGTPCQPISHEHETAVLKNVDHVLTTAEVYFLRQENENLKKKLLKGEGRMSFQSICNDDTLVFQYTGLPTAAHFITIANLLKKFELSYYLGWKVEALCLNDQLLMTLMKLRLNLRYFDLAFRFKVCTATAHNVVLTILYALHETIFVGMMSTIPSTQKTSSSLPQCFAHFPNCRIIIDCTEVEVAVPPSLKDQKVTFSHYKQRHTFKVLIGVAPNATITFVSKLYPGSTSDKAITADCGVLDQLSAGDLVLADKGFLISDLCKERGIQVNIPPFLCNPQFTVEEALITRRIARARIHVERAIARLKSFSILDFIRSSLRDHSTVIVQTCAALVNFQYSLLKENEQCRFN